MRSDMTPRTEPMQPVALRRVANCVISTAANFGAAWEASFDSFEKFVALNPVSTWY
jgi:hypothetical protein